MIFSPKIDEFISKSIEVYTPGFKLAVERLRDIYWTEINKTSYAHYRYSHAHDLMISLKSFYVHMYNVEILTLDERLALIYVSYNAVREIRGDSSYIDFIAIVNPMQGCTVRSHVYLSYVDDDLVKLFIRSDFFKDYFADEVLFEKIFIEANRFFTPKELFSPKAYEIFIRDEDIFTKDFKCAVEKAHKIYINGMYNTLLSSVFAIHAGYLANNIAIAYGSRDEITDIDQIAILYYAYNTACIDFYIDRYIDFTCMPRGASLYAEHFFIGGEKLVKLFASPDRIRYWRGDPGFLLENISDSINNLYFKILEIPSNIQPLISFFKSNNSDILNSRVNGLLLSYFCSESI